MFGLVLLDYVDLGYRRVVYHFASYRGLLIIFILFTSYYYIYHLQSAQYQPPQSPSTQLSAETLLANPILGRFLRLLFTRPFRPITTITCSSRTSDWPFVISITPLSFTHYYLAGSSAFTMPVSSPITQISPVTVCFFIYSILTHNVKSYESGPIYFTLP